MAKSSKGQKNPEPPVAGRPKRLGNSLSSKGYARGKNSIKGQKRFGGLLFGRKGELLPDQTIGCRRVAE